MKKLITLFAICFSLSAFAQEPKDTTVSIATNLSVWEIILNEMNYANDRVKESNLTDLQKARVDSSMTQITRFFVSEINRQLTQKASANNAPTNKEQPKK